MFENGNGAKENSFSSTVHLFDVSQFIPSLIVVRVFLARLDKKVKNKILSSIIDKKEKPLDIKT